MILKQEQNILGTLQHSELQLTFHDSNLVHSDDASLELYETSINSPIVVTFPQNNYVKRDDLLSVIYP
jgi:hypothetical protein